MNKIFLITGFLGSGKTTFLNNLLENQNNKIGLLVNEFGKISIDGIRLNDTTSDLIQLNNGSIFCTCLKDDFIQSLKDLINKNLDYIFIESSGLSDPANMNTILSFLKEQNCNDFTYCGSISIVDAQFFLQILDKMINVEQQIKCSSVAIINKIDLVDNEKILEVKNKIKLINNNTKIIETSYGKIDFNKINDVIPLSFESETSNKEDNKPKTFTIKLNQNISKEVMENIVVYLKDYSFRIKGYFSDGINNYKLDTVLDDVNICIEENNFDNTIVLISSVGLKLITEINKCIKNYDISCTIDY